jgi:hypothetical protein
MDYMIKFYQNYSDGGDSYYIGYKLYSGSSERTIKENILSDLSYEFNNEGVGKEISEINLDLSIEDMQDEIIRIMEDLIDTSSRYGAMEEYELELSVCEDENDAFKFYGAFLDHCDSLDDDEAADQQIAFESDGESARKIVSFIENSPLGGYIMKLLRDYNIHVTQDLIDKLSKKIG